MYQIPPTTYRLKSIDVVYIIPRNEPYAYTISFTTKCAL